MKKAGVETSPVMVPVKRLFDRFLSPYEGTASAPERPIPIHAAALRFADLKAEGGRGFPDAFVNEFLHRPRRERRRYIFLSAVGILGVLCVLAAPVLAVGHARAGLSLLIVGLGLFAVAARHWWFARYQRPTRALVSASDAEAVVIERLSAFVEQLGTGELQVYDRVQTGSGVEWRRLSPRYLGSDNVGLLLFNEPDAWPLIRSLKAPPRGEIFVCEQSLEALGGDAQSNMPKRAKGLSAALCDPDAMSDADVAAAKAASLAGLGEREAARVESVFRVIGALRANAGDDRLPYKESRYQDAVVKTGLTRTTVEKIALGVYPPANRLLRAPSAAEHARREV